MNLFYYLKHSFLSYSYLNYILLCCDVPVSPQGCLKFNLDSLLFEVAGLRSDADRHVAACVEVAALDGDPRAPRNGPLRWLDTGEEWSLEEKENVS